MSYYDQKLVNTNAEQIIDGLFTDVDELLASSERVQTSSLDSDPDQLINRLFRDIDDLLESQETSNISISEFLDPEYEAIDPLPTPQVSDDDQPFSREPIPYQSRGELTEKTANSFVTPTTPAFTETDSQQPSSSSPSFKNLHRNKIILGSSCSLLLLALLLIATQRNWSQFEMNQLPDEDTLTNVIEEVPNPITGSDSQKKSADNSNEEFIDYMEQASQQIHRQRRQAQQQEEKSELEKLRESLEALKRGQEKLRQHQLALAKQATTQPSSSIPPHPPQPTASAPPPPPSEPTPSSSPSKQTASAPPPPPSEPQSGPTSSSSQMPDSSAPSQSKSEDVPESSKASESDQLPSLPPVPSESESEQVFSPQKQSESNDVGSPENSSESTQSEMESYKLVGVLELEEMESAALLEKGGNTQRILQGEMLPGSGWKLVNVSNQTATFEKDGNQKSLSVGQKL